MFFEWLGKFCFSKISSFVFYVLIFSPILFAIGYLGLQYVEMSNREELFIASCKKGRVALEKKEKKQKFMQRYGRADPYFLDKQIESLVFLQKEKEELKELLKHPALCDEKPIASRLQWIESEENRLRFTEEAIRSTSSIKETEEKQRHTVQMDETDVKKLLSLMEDVSIDSFSSDQNSPQIIMTDFYLEKKETALKSEVFEVEMQFVKREFLK